MKKKLAVVMLIVLVLTLAVFIYKGYYKDIIGNYEKHSNDATDELKKNVKPQKTELDVADEDNYVNVGEEFFASANIQVKDGKSVYQEKSKVKCLDYYIARENDTGLEISWYKDDEKERLNSEGDFFDSYYYLVVDIEVTNMECTSSETGEKIIAVDSRIRTADNGKITSVNEEARTRYYMGDKVDNIRGNMTLELQESGIIRLIYVISDEISKSDMLLDIYNNGIKYSEYKYIRLKKN